MLFGAVGSMACVPRDASRTSPEELDADSAGEHRGSAAELSEEMARPRRTTGDNAGSVASVGGRRPTGGRVGTVDELPDHVEAVLPFTGLCAAVGLPGAARGGRSRAGTADLDVVGGVELGGLDAPL